MSISSITTRRLDVPGEDAWIDVKPLSAKLLHTIQLEAARIGREALLVDEYDVDASGYAETSLLLGNAIVAWSYEVPVNQDNVDDLDLGTTAWLKEKLMEVAEVPLTNGAPSTGSSAETQTE